MGRPELTQWAETGETSGRSETLRRVDPVGTGDGSSCGVCRFVPLRGKHLHLGLAGVTCVESRVSAARTVTGGVGPVPTCHRLVWV